MVKVSRALKLSSTALTGVLLMACQTVPQNPPSPQPSLRPDLPAAYQNIPIIQPQPQIVVIKQEEPESVLQTGEIFAQIIKPGIKPIPPEELEEKVQEILQPKLANAKSELFGEVKAQTQAYTDKQVMALAQKTSEQVNTALQNTANTVANQLKGYAEQQVAALENRTLEKLNKTDAISKQQLRQEAATLVANVEQRLKEFAEDRAQYMAKATSGNIAQLIAQSRLTPDDIRAITEETLANSSDEIRALALQTIVNSSDLLDTYAQQAVRAQLAETTAKVAQIDRTALVSAEQAKRYSAEQVRQLEQQIAQLKVENTALKSTTQQKLTETENKFNQLTTASVGELKQFTAAQVKDLEKTLQNLRVENQQLQTAMQKDLSKTQTEALVLANKAEQESALKAEEAKRYALEQIASLSKDNAALQIAMNKDIQAATTQIKQDLKETQSATLAKLAETQKQAALQLKETEKNAALKAEESKRYALEQIASLNKDNAALQLALSKDIQNSTAQTTKATADLKTGILAELQNLRLENNRLKQALENRVTVAEKSAKSSVELTAEQTKRYLAEQLRETDEQLAALRMQDAELNRKRDLALAELAQQSRAELAALEQRTKQQIDTVAQAQAAAAENRVRSFAAAELTKLSKQTQQSLAEMDAATRAELSTQAVELAQNVAQQLRDYTATKVVQAQRTSAQTAAELAQSARLTEDEIRTVTLATLQDERDSLKALTLQTLAESDNYIRTVARQAVQDGDEGMRNALASAAKQVIYNENNDVAFAIREIAGVELDRRLAQIQQFGSDVIEASDGVDLHIATPRPPRGEGIVMHSPKHRDDWVNIRDYDVVVHVDNVALKQILQDVLDRAKPFVGPWELKWKISKENEDILNERFSLDAETDFETFANYIAQFMFNTRGIPITFNLFDGERVLVVSDE